MAEASMVLWRRIPLAMLFAAWASGAAAQSTSSPPMPTMPNMPGMDMPAPAKLPPAKDDMAGMDMSGMAPMAMTGALGDYGMNRDGAGTSWQPDSSPHQGVHGAWGPWSLMAHGDGTLVYDDQGGPRGSTKTFFESMLMGMASRPLDGGELTLHGMVSLDPTMGKGGYPELLQTGETADGKTPLIDRQHPHNFIDELSVTYSHPLIQGLGGFVYLADPGEPALGPVTFMHRFSGMMNPEAPIDHHWLDSTHVTFGVATAGLVIADTIKFELSDFTGREPDQYRWGFNAARFDSGSWRLTWNPTRDLSMQVSQGWLHSPEQLTPDQNQRRTTASVTYNRAYKIGGAGGNWQTTVAWGQDADMPGRTLDAYLVESAASFGPHTVFARAEQVDKDDLFLAPSVLAGDAFRVGKLSLGYAYSFPAGRHFLIDLGGLVSVYDLPTAIKPAYGSDPRSFMIFTRVRLN